MHLDSVDRRLLNLMQTEFPLIEEPYSRMGQRLGTEAGEVIQRITRLKQMKIIRLIGPVLDSRSLGYHPTLVAMRIEDSHLGKSEESIAVHPGVSHGYERDHYFNVWFTLAVPPNVDIGCELEQLIHASGAESAFSLPARKMFKIGAYFDIDEEIMQVTRSPMVSAFPKKTDLSSNERLIINTLQQDLPLVPKPFNDMAEQTGIPVEQFLAQCRALIESGVIRRFSASINHNNAGFSANAMACWVAPPDTIDIVGGKLASLKEVSHCYERETNPLWCYNLFAMIHCRSRELCHEIAAQVSRETGLTDYVLLFSTREFKKTRVKYAV